LGAADGARAVRASAGAAGGHFNLNAIQKAAFAQESLLEGFQQAGFPEFFMRVYF
jgi:hypothetical protein